MLTRQPEEHREQELGKAVPPTLSVSGLTVDLGAPQDRLRILSDVTFTVPPRGRVGIVGESGCGKSMTARAVIGLLPASATVSGDVVLDGLSLTGLRGKEMEDVRGRRVGMIFQEPMSSLNPVLSIGDQLTEGMRRHFGFSRKVARAKGLDLLRQVGLPRGEGLLDEYPHQLSGGMCQRVMIAIALSCSPKLLIADEATTALDVTTQAQIVALMRKVQEDFETSLLVISHDLGVIAELCDHMIVMYAGQIVEQGATAEVLAQPHHPYTVGLLAANPALVRGRQRLATIPGRVPDFSSMPSGCRFRPRCAFSSERCLTEPPLAPMVPGSKRDVRCWHPRNEAGRD